MRALLDTCILFDIIARRMSFEESLKLLMPHSFGDLELWVSAKSYTDIFHIMKKQAASANIQRVFQKSYKQFTISSVDKETLERAAELAWPDFEDCLISACAKKIGADVIITHDEKGFALSSVEACSPADVLKLFQDLGIQYKEIVFLTLEK